jgi:hypothetical protein
MFLQPTDLFSRKKEFISCPFMLSLVAFRLDYGSKAIGPNP